MNENINSAGGRMWLLLCVVITLVSVGAAILGYKHYSRVTEELRAIDDYERAKAQSLERRVEQLESENSELRNRLVPAAE